MQSFNETQHSRRLCKVQTVAELYDVSVPTIWRWVREKKFPAPIKLSPGCTRWRFSDLEPWEATQ